MKKWSFFILICCVSVAFLSTGCKSQFEKVRVSGDTDLIYKKAFEYFEAGEYQRSQTLFELIIPAYRGKKELENIYFTYAYTYYHLSRFILSNYYFKNFASTFPSSTLKEEGEFMAAYSNYQLSPNYRLDQTYSEQAIDDFQTFVNTYPTSERVKECNRLIDEMRIKLEKKALEEANLYFDLRQYQAAAVSYENMLKDFPETTNVEQVRYKIAKSAFLLAQNSIYDKQKERYEDVITRAEDFLHKFSKSPHSSEIRSYKNSSLKKLKEFSNGRHQNQSARTRS